MNEDVGRLRNRIAVARAKPDIDSDYLRRREEEAGESTGKKPAKHVVYHFIFILPLRDRTIHYGCHGEDKGNDDKLYLLSNLFVVLLCFSHTQWLFSTFISLHYQ